MIGAGASQVDLELTVSGTTNLTAGNEEALTVENIEQFVHLSIKSNFLFFGLLLSPVQNGLQLSEHFFNIRDDGAILEEYLFQQNVDFQPRLQNHGRQINGQFFVGVVPVVTNCSFFQQQSLLEDISQSWKLALRKFCRFPNIFKNSF